MMKEVDTPGYESNRIPVFTNIMKRKMYFGADRKIAVMNFGIIVALATMTRVGWCFVLLPITHIFCVWLTKKHPDALSIYAKYRTYDIAYRSWLTPRPWKRNRRPIGFGRI